MLTRALSVVALGACGTYTTYQTAEPLPAGRWHVQGALTPGVFVDRPSKVTTPTAIFEVVARRGIGHDVDLGLKLYSAGIEGNARWRFFDEQWSWALIAA